MAGITRGSFEKPSETRTPDKMKVEVVDLGDHTAARVTYEPGWRWEDSVKPIVGTEKCEAFHLGTMVSGRLHVEHGDGTSYDIGPGDAFVIEPGHVGWVVGDEPAVAYEFASAESYGK